MTRKICIGAMMLGLMLNGASAWADVDISGKEKIEVGTWADLKTAVESSANVGKVIVLTANIQADVNTPITSVGGAGIIIDGGGHTITGQEGTSYGQLIKFDSSDKTDLIIQNVTLKGFGGKASYAYGGAIYNSGTIGDISGDFTSNSAQGSSSAYGGAIYNSGFSARIENIIGNFEGNSAQDSYYAEGGAIYNSGGTIGDISGDFTSNSAQGSSYAYGGAIYNSGSSARIENIIGNFEGNSAQGSSSAFGGAIYNSGTIGDISGDFEGNSAQSGSYYANGGAIYNYDGIIGDISGDFEGNYAQSDSSYANGGAIYNRGTIGDISGDFEGNYAQSTGTSSSSYAYGGAIYNYGGTIGDISGDFMSNSAQSGSYYAYGGAIYNNGSSARIENIIGNFSNNYAQSASSYAEGGAIYNNSGTIGDISGDFEGNYAQSTGTSRSSYANGGAIYNYGGTIGDISGDFTSNSAQGSSRAFGGAIYNEGSSARIENIIGNFEGNSAQSDSSYALGGAIYNEGTIGDISGDFTNNYAQSDSSHAEGGAIYNEGSALTLVNSSFKDNYVQTGAEKDSLEGKMTLGGAIASLGDLTIQADKGESIFSGNKVKWADGEEASAITMMSQSSPLKLMLDSRNQGLIQFDDKISSLSFLDLMLLQAEAQGAMVQDDGEGGYLVDMGGEQFHLKKTENGVLFPQGQESGLSQADVEQKLATFPPECDVKQEGDNFIVTGEGGGQMWVFEFVKQEDDTYVMTQNMLLTEYGATMVITGDSTSKVVFNNTIEKMEKIDISGTNVEVNEGAGTIYRTITHDGGVLNINAGAKAEDSILNNLGTMNVNGGAAQSTVVNSGGVMNVAEGGSAVETEVNDGGAVNVNGGAAENTVVNSGGVMNIAEGGSAVETEVNDGGAVNVNGGAAENTVVNSGGVMNIAESGSAVETEVNGTLHVSSGGLAENTVVNKDGLLVAENQAKVNNMLANDGAKLDIDAGSYLTGDIVIHAGASMGGSYDYGKIFKDEVVDSGSLTLVGGLNDILNENSLINTTAEKKLNLTAGDYVIGDGAQAVRGWDLLTIKDTATVKLEGDITLNGPNKKLIIENGSKLDLAGHSPSDYTITGSVNNDGTLVFTHQDDGADDVTTIYGNYKAYQNAKMDIDVDPINNVADLLKIEGDVEGKTDVVLYALSPERPSEMIKFVEAPNDDLSTGAAFSIFRVYGSGYQWNSLHQDGNWYTATNDIIPDGSTDGYGDSDVGAMEDDEDLEADADLPSEFPNPDEGEGSNPDEGEGTDPDEGEGTDPDEGEGTDPDEGEGTDPDEGEGSNPDEGGSTPPAQPSVVGEAIAYMGLPSAGIEQTRGMTRRVADKVMATKLYNQKCGGFYDCRYDGNRLYNAWVSPVYTYSDVKAPYRYEADVSGVEAGFDLQSDAFNRLGVFFSYRQGNYDFDGKGDDYSSKIGSEIDIDSYIAGLFHRYDKGRLWTMEQLFVGYQDVDIASDDGVSAGTDGVEFGASVGAGVVYTPLPDVTVEPMITADYTQINYDNLSDNYGKTARFKDVRYLELEAGVKVEKTFKRQFGYAKFYLKPSLVQTFGRGKVQVSSLSLVDGIENMTLGRLELGGSINFDNAWSGYANAAYTFGSDYLNAAVNAGLNYAF